MKTIWKFTLDGNHQICCIPKGAKFLTSKEQNGKICIWAEVDPENPTELRTVRVRGTGVPLPCVDEDEYVGSVLTSGGSLVWHVYVGPATI